MRKTILIAAMMVLCLGSMSAQRGGQQRMTVEQQVENLTKELNLTEEQQKQVTAI